MRKQYLIFTALIIIVVSVVIVGFIYYESQSEVRRLIAQQQAQSESYQWLLEGLVSDELPKKQKRDLRVRIRYMDRNFKSNAIEWASQGTTLGNQVLNPVVVNENQLEDDVTFQEAEEIARDKIKEYQRHPDAQIELKAIVLTDRKQSYIWGFGFTSSQSPFYLLFYDGEFSSANTDQDYRHAMLRVPIETGHAENVVLSLKPKVDNYFYLKKIELEKDSSRIY